MMVAHTYTHTINKNSINSYVYNNDNSRTTLTTRGADADRVPPRDNLVRLRFFSTRDKTNLGGIFGVSREWAMFRQQWFVRFQLVQRFAGSVCRTKNTDQNSVHGSHQSPSYGDQ